MPARPSLPQGETGEVFFIIEQGSVICRNLGGDQSNNVLHEGDYFGERALLKSEPRAADVFAESGGCTLIALHRDDFVGLLGHLRELLEYNVGMRLLLCVPMLSALSDDQRASLFSSLRVASFGEGEVIVPAGTVPHEFYIVKEGSVKVVSGPIPGAAGEPATSASDHPPGDEPSVCGPLLHDSHAHSHGHSAAGLLPSDSLLVLQPGHFFPARELSEQAALSVSYVAVAPANAPSSTSSRAKGSGPVQCFVTDRATYMAVLAPYVTAMAEQAAARSKAQQQPSGSQRSGSAPASQTDLQRGGSSSSRSSHGASRVEGDGSEQRQQRPASRDSSGRPIAPAHSHSASGSAGSASRRSRGASDVEAGSSQGGSATTSQRHGGRGSTGGHSRYSSVSDRPARRRLGIPFGELEQRATVGTGTFGRVRLVMHRKSSRVFALKMLQKSQVVALKQQGNILNERALLWRMDHPFIIKLFDTYRDRDRLYMLLELVQGGELFSRLQNASAPGRISVSEARFYAACVLDALDYMHAQHVLYRCVRAQARYRRYRSHSMGMPRSPSLPLVRSAGPGPLTLPHLQGPEARKPVDRQRRLPEAGGLWLRKGGARQDVHGECGKGAVKATVRMRVHAALPYLPLRSCTSVALV